MTEKEIVAFSDSRIIFSDKVIGILFKEQPPLLFQLEARLTSKTHNMYGAVCFSITTDTEIYSSAHLGHFISLLFVP